MGIRGGTHGSRRLTAPRGAATRPTSDRVREALFGILGAGRVELSGARVLDLFAGSGALAFEALSRGAAGAVLVERARPALEAARANARALGVEAVVELLGVPVERGLRDLGARGARFTLVLVDPPYAEVKAAAQALSDAGAGLLEVEGVLVLEHASRDDAPTIAHLDRLETRIYGDTALSFYAREERDC